MMSVPVDGILYLVFKPDSEQERIVRGGRGGVAGQPHSAPHQAGHPGQAGGVPQPHHAEAEAAPGEAQHSEHQHCQHQPAGILQH